MFSCAYCNSEIEKDSFFCDQCGKEILLCETCKLPGRSQWCEEDGGALIAAKSTAAANAPALVHTSVPGGNTTPPADTSAPAGTPSTVGDKGSPGGDTPAVTAINAPSGTPSTVADKSSPGGDIPAVTATNPSQDAPAATAINSSGGPALSTGNIKNPPSATRLRLVNANLGISLDIQPDSILGRTTGPYAASLGALSAISGKHLSFKHDVQHGWSFADMGSSNGTKYSKTNMAWQQTPKAVPDTPVTLENKAYILIANVEFVIQIEGGSSTSTQRL